VSACAVNSNQPDYGRAVRLAVLLRMARASPTRGQFGAGQERSMFLATLFSLTPLPGLSALNFRSGWVAHCNMADMTYRSAFATAGPPARSRVPRFVVFTSPPASCPSVHVALKFLDVVCLRDARCFRPRAE